MRKVVSKKIRITSFDLSKEKIIKKPLNILKRINLDKLKKITYF